MLFVWILIKKSYLKDLVAESVELRKYGNSVKKQSNNLSNKKSIFIGDRQMTNYHSST